MKKQHVQKIMLMVAAVVFLVLLVVTFQTPGKIQDVESYEPQVYASPFALLPPVIAIGLALITKEVYSSLFVGILMGGLLYSDFCNWSFVHDSGYVSGNAGLEQHSSCNAIHFICRRTFQRRGVYVADGGTKICGTDNSNASDEPGIGIFHAWGYRDFVSDSDRTGNVWSLSGIFCSFVVTG